MGGHAAIGGAGLEPFDQGALFLEAQEAPGQLQHAAAHPGIAGAGEALLAAPRAALVGRPGDPAVPRHRPSVAQVAHQHLVHQHVRGLDADSVHARQQDEHGVGGVRRGLPQSLQARALDLSDLLFDQLQTGDIAPQFGQGVGRQRRPLRRAQSRQALCGLAQMAA